MFKAIAANADWIAPIANTSAWKLKLLAVVAYVLGVQFKIEGMPFGAARKNQKENIEQAA